MLKRMKKKSRLALIIIYTIHAFQAFWMENVFTVANAVCVLCISFRISSVLQWMAAARVCTSMPETGLPPMSRD